MRLVLTGLVIAIGLASMPAATFAGSSERSGVLISRKSAKAQAAYERKLRRQQEAADELRAEYLDPAGDYKAYPGWARAALSPKNDNGVRF